MKTNFFQPKLCHWVYTNMTLLDLWKDPVQRIDAAVLAVIDASYDIGLDADYFHFCWRWIHSSEKDDTRYRKAFYTNGFIDRVNFHKHIFDDTPRRVPREEQHDDFEEAECVILNKYKPGNRLIKALKSISKKAGVELETIVVDKIQLAYGLLIDIQKRNNNGNLLNMWYVLYKLIEQYVEEPYRSELLRQIRLPRRQRLARWDQRYRRICDGYECLRYRPTLKYKQSYRQPVPYDVSDLIWQRKNIAGSLSDV